MIQQDIEHAAMERNTTVMVRQTIQALLLLQTVVEALVNLVAAGVEAVEVEDLEAKILIYKDKMSCFLGCFKVLERMAHGLLMIGLLTTQIETIFGMTQLYGSTLMMLRDGNYLFYMLND